MIKMQNMLPWLLQDPGGDGAALFSGHCHDEVFVMVIICLLCGELKFVDGVKRDFSLVILQLHLLIFITSLKMT